MALPAACDARTPAAGTKEEALWQLAARRKGWPRTLACALAPVVLARSLLDVVQRTVVEPLFHALHALALALALGERDKSEGAQERSASHSLRHAVASLSVFFFRRHCELDSPARREP